MEEILNQLLQEKKITAEILQNIQKWLSQGRNQKEIQDLLSQKNWEELKDAFFQTIPFGTGGRRGKMGPGPNRINIYTIMDSAQGVLDYLKEIYPGEELSTVIACDTRHGSREFAEAVAKVFAANGGKAYLYPSFRSTPQLSFSVRYLKTHVGMMISASHNPPSDNGIKVYWKDGGQVVPPYDVGIIERVEKVDQPKSISKEEGIKQGRIIYLDQKIDDAYISLLASQVFFPQERKLRITFSPLHGVGLTNAYAALEKAGFKEIFKVESQCIPDGNFSAIKNNSPNPEMASAMEGVLKLGDEVNADIALATDPDADRLGVGVKTAEGWRLLTGNEIGTLLLYHILQSCKDRQKLSSSSVVVKTLPTSGVISAIARHFGVQIMDDLLVGFKYIAYEMETSLGKNFLFGTEESHGYLLGTEVRDKDGAMSALLISEIAASLKTKGKTLIDSLKEIYQKVGYYKNLLHSFSLPGLKGKDTIDHLLKEMRENPPQNLGSCTVSVFEDHLHLKRCHVPQKTWEDFPRKFQGDMLVFLLRSPESAIQARFILRPSGTEPKMKAYFEMTAKPSGNFDSWQKEMNLKAESMMKSIVQDLTTKMEKI